MIYGFGLIAPLTPSEGMPSIIEIVIFAIFPLFLSLAGTFLVKSMFAKLHFIIESLAIAGTYITLLRMQLSN